MKVEDYWVNEILGNYAKDFEDLRHNSQFIKIIDIDAETMSLTFCYDDMKHSNDDTISRISLGKRFIHTFRTTLIKSLKYKVSKVIEDLNSVSDDAFKLKVTRIE